MENVDLEKILVDDFNQLMFEDIKEIYYVDEENLKSFKDNENISIDDKILLILQRFLFNSSINGYENLPPVTMGCGQESIVYGNNGHKELRMRLYKPKYRVLSNIIKDKFREDRYNFFWTKDIKRLEIDLGKNSSKYENLDDFVRLTVITDNFNNIVIGEREFLSELLNYLFDRENKEIVINKVYDKDFNKTKNNVLGYEICCGDISITFSNKYSFSFLFSVVDEYNRKINNYKDKMKKRQLKLEGF